MNPSLGVGSLTKGLCQKAVMFFLCYSEQYINFHFKRLEISGTELLIWLYSKMDEHAYISDDFKRPTVMWPCSTLLAGG